VGNGSANAATKFGMRAIEAEALAAVAFDTRRISPLLRRAEE
jgi:hypothetical protein